MEKVKLSKEIAGAIEWVRSELQWGDAIILRKVSTNGWDAVQTQCLNVGDNDKLALDIANALITGFETEEI